MQGGGGLVKMVPDLNRDFEDRNMRGSGLMHIVCGKEMESHLWQIGDKPDEGRGGGE